MTTENVDEIPTVAALLAANNEAVRLSDEAFRASELGAASANRDALMAAYQDAFRVAGKAYMAYLAARQHAIEAQATRDYWSAPFEQPHFNGR